MVRGQGIDQGISTVSAIAPGSMFAAWAVVIGVAMIGCGGATPPARVAAPPSVASPVTPTTSVPAPPAAPKSPIRFDWIEDSGIDLVYYGNPSPEHYMTEQNGGGIAILDYDGDGLQDVYLTNGDHFAHPAAAQNAGHQLYRNVTGVAGRVRFEAVGSMAGVSQSGFGMGAHAADYDNDGFPDLFVCYYGAIQLWRNNGDGTFIDVTSAAGLSGTEWAASAAFADLDEDGDLDVYVANYVVYASTDAPCFVQTTQRIPISCGPIGRVAQADRLWENCGDGTFRDASESSGIHAVPAGKGLAVEIVDLTGDDLLDIYVANDTTENFLFVNRGGLKFEELGLVRGVAVGPRGQAESSMGIASADFDHNGRFDLFVTNFENAVNDFYLNLSEEGFLHASAPYGLDLPSRPMLAFGAIAADFDLDDWPDRFVANGHIWDLTAGQDKHRYEMPPQLFRNREGRRFDDVSRAGGAYFERDWLGRPAAAADFNNDGLTDLIVGHLRKPPAVLINASEMAGRSLTVRLIGREAARTPLGIRVAATVDGEVRHYHALAGGSYQANSDPRVVIRTSDKSASVSLQVAWSSASMDRWTALPISGAIDLRQRGVAPRPDP
jgi:hypothetical protein